MGSFMTYIGLVFAIWINYIVVKAFRRNSAIIKEEKRLEKQGVNGNINLIHLEGLDFREASEVYLTAGRNIIKIAAGRKKYAIDIERINDISIQSIDKTISDKNFFIDKASINNILSKTVDESLDEFSGDDLSEFKTMIINFTGKEEESNNIVFMPKYSDANNKVSVKEENKELDEIVDNINCAVSKKKKRISSETIT